LASYQNFKRCGHECTRK